MDVFTTKSGKVYKVSLRNFNAATGKKAPYYKRVKIDGKFVEKAYAICPACGNPVHFVNLFNKKKQKKAHARHQRSSVKGLAKYNATAYKSCPYVQKEASPSKQTKKVSGLDALRQNIKTQGIPSDFYSVMSDAFGFSEKSIGLLAEIYNMLAYAYPETASQKFFAYFASVSYNPRSFQKLLSEISPESIKTFGLGQIWNAIGNIGSADLIKRRIVKLGFKKAEIEELFSELDEQHRYLLDESSTYYRKLDFAHLCATAATLLSSNESKNTGDIVAGAVNGIYSTDATAGYVGDLCGILILAPSMNDADYKADLDAVNISTLVQNSPDKSLLSVMTDYLGSIESGEINRAREFKKTISIEELKVQRDAYKNRLKQADIVANQIEGPFLTFDNAAKKKNLNNRVALFDNFIECIENDESGWPDE